MLGEWLLKEYRHKELKATEDLINNRGNSDVQRGIIAGMRQMRERLMTIRTIVLEERK